MAMPARQAVPADVALDDRCRDFGRTARGLALVTRVARRGFRADVFGKKAARRFERPSWLIRALARVSLQSFDTPLREMLSVFRLKCFRMNPPIA